MDAIAVSSLLRELWHCSHASTGPARCHMGFSPLVKTSNAKKPPVSIFPPSEPVFRMVFGLLRIYLICLRLLSCSSAKKWTSRCSAGGSKSSHLLNVAVGLAVGQDGAMTE